VFIAACNVVIGQQSAAGPYTAAQATSGRAAYAANCSSCHAPDLSGREGPPLAGANFMSQWGAKTTGELISFMRLTMPPGAAASLPDQTLSIWRHLFSTLMGGRPGERALAGEGGVALRSVVSGQRAAYLLPGTAQQGTPDPIAQREARAGRGLAGLRWPGR
jgi:hypothetical protein